jgi:hypothetical protein
MTTQQSTLPIERRVAAHFDRATFEREFREKNRPVVISGLASEWIKRPAWNLENLARTYGAATITALVDLPEDSAPYLNLAAEHERDMSVADFIQLLNDPSRKKPCYLDQMPIHAACPELLAEMSLAPFLDHGIEDGATNLWFGSMNTRSGLHFDNADNLLVQVLGRKRAFLISPQDSRSVYPLTDNPSKSPIDPELPAPEDFPKFAKIDVLTAELEPGDALFIPYYWWHHIRSLQTSISVNHWWMDKGSSRQLYNIVAAGGPAYWAKTARDFVVHGVMGRPHHPRLLSSTPIGLMLYGLLASVAERQIDRLKHRASPRSRT